MAHKDEFTLLFGVPMPGLDDGRFDVAAGMRPGVRGDVLRPVHRAVERRAASRCPDAAEIDAGLRAQLGRFGAALRTDAPDGALLVFLRCWVLLYGAVSMEVFGHLGFALDDPAPMFEYTVADLARLVGLDYPPPVN